jgi:hypothetical protein
LPIGGHDLDEHLLGLLRVDTQLLEDYNEPIDIEFARELKESGNCGLPYDDDSEDRDERIECDYNGKQVT